MSPNDIIDILPINRSILCNIHRTTIMLMHILRIVRVQTRSPSSPGGSLERGIERVVVWLVGLCEDLSGVFFRFRRGVGVYRSVIISYE